jgi:hypothetical protein
LRWLFGMLTIGSMVAAASYSMDKPIQPLPYANEVSHAFAAGDNHDSSGWMECKEAERSDSEVGIVCEGTRNIVIHGEQLTVVNYFCEFQFKQVLSGAYHVNYGLCQ